MNVNEFREKVKPDIKLIVQDKKFDVREVIKFRFDDGNYYVKCFLSDGYVFADDEEENIFLLVQPIETPFEPPFGKTLRFDNKNFTFLYDAHAIAEDISGEEIFKKGESEKFWDYYKTEDNSYLSLGINDQTNKRMDFYGKIISPTAVHLKS